MSRLLFGGRWRLRRNGPPWFGAGRHIRIISFGGIAVIPYRGCGLDLDGFGVDRVCLLIYRIRVDVRIRVAIRIGKVVAYHAADQRGAYPAAVPSAFMPRSPVPAAADICMGRNCGKECEQQDR